MKKKPIEQVEEPVAIYQVYPTQDRELPVAPEETIQRIRLGLPMIEFEALCELLGLGAETLAAHLGISRSTLIRRRAVRRLDMRESDALLRYARLYAQAQEVFESDATAREWLHQPARALGGATPLEFAETEVGAREVSALLGRIEHGIFG